MTDFEPHEERRDTSWVQGELATDFKNFPRGGMQRIPLDARYYLTTPHDFSKIVENTVIDHRNYKKAKFDCENFAFAFQSVVAQQYGLNSVGVVIDYEGGHGYNIVMYEDGTTELFEPQNDTLVSTGDTMSDHEAYTIEEGFIIL
jgi:hypothetical protein